MKVLAADVGATKTRLAVVEPGESFLRIEAEATHRSAAYDGLESLALAFLAEQGVSVDAAAFGMPGPVVRGRVRTTNLPWEVTAGDLARALGIRHVTLLNDLEATAYGIGELDPEDVEVLAEGDTQAGGNAALIAPGTGLGEAGLFWDGGRFRPFATEGGHCDFGPADDTDFALQQHLAARSDHVSWEQVLSGPGLLNIHEFLRDHRGSPVPEWLERDMQTGDPAAAIANAAEARTCPVCSEAMDRFVYYFGAEAGNLGLKFMATGGVFLGGGIAPRIAGRLLEPDFLEAFLSKGRMRELMERMPVKLIRNDRAALLGAARSAALA
ncbi:glucokinase [Thiohalorhabdus sp.]|uniref:glucokinase n=1 Tax=Thiohalorhabdus sp. TaxID=3094134 RepID=UPI002FC29D76